MKKLFSILTLFLTVSFVNAQQATVKNVNPTEFKNLIGTNNGILLDVRTSYEFEDEHINGAKQLNYYSFSFTKNLLLLPKDKPIYVYCRSGYRSNKASKILIKNGYKNVYNLKNGIKDWESEKYPTVSN
ncbi:MAG: rhodanese-like domain-containing protein [Lutibacter sp.]|uniref:rhodanese-like domain-containing protein n=1 Tax=Lutibacter sp. TaxID=1925666 RepID=UPI00385D972C